MNKLFRYFCAVLAVLLLLPFAAACNKVEVPTDDTEAPASTPVPDTDPPTSDDVTATDATTEPPEPPREPTTLDLTKEPFKFTLASDLDPSISKFTTPLLQNLTAARLSFEVANDLAEFDPETPEIIVGNAARDETRKLSSGLRSDDYIIALSGKKLVINGGSTDAIGKAVYYYLSNYAVKKLFFYEEGEIYRFTGKYDVNVGTLAGEALGAYKIIYAAGNTVSKAAAELLAVSIEKRLGYGVPVLSDGSRESEREIIVGKTSRKAEMPEVDGKNYIIKNSGTKMLIGGGSYQALVDGGNELIDLLSKSDDLSNLDIIKPAGGENGFYDILTGKTLYIIGDSYFAGEGLDRTTQVWPAMLKLKYGMTFENYGIGGSVISNYISTNTPIVDRIKSMKAGSPDIIFLEGGANDWNHDIPLGSPEDAPGTKTFCGSLRSCIEQLHEKYPGAFIVCITCWDYGTNNKIGLSSKSYASAMVEVAALYDFAASVNASISPCPVRMTDEAFRAEYSISANDKSHLNLYGQAFVFPFFEKRVAELYAEFKK